MPSGQDETICHSFILLFYSNNFIEFSFMSFSLAFYSERSIKEMERMQKRALRIVYNEFGNFSVDLFIKENIPINL